MRYIYCGIYKIQSISHPERIYIGSAGDIISRWWAHRRLLRKNKHHSRILQNHYNKYGEEDLEFYFDSLCDPSELIEREQALINFFKPYFNVSPTAGSPRGMKHSEESKLHMSIAHRGKTQSPELVEARRRGNFKPVLQLDDNGVVVKEWEGIILATYEGFDAGHITECCKGRRRKTGGFYWKYKN